MNPLTDDQPLSSIEKISALKMHSEKESRSRAGESKADARYWMKPGRLRFNNSPNYSFQIQSRGTREWFALGTPNKKGASSKAAEIYSFIQAHGIDAAIEKYKPKAETENVTATVGRLIEEAKKISTARQQSFGSYTKAFRKIVAEIAEIDDSKKKDFHGGGSAAWRAKVDAVCLVELTPAAVVAWKNARLKAAEADPLAKRRAIVTVNSLIRCAKSLFGKKILPFVEQVIPLPRPLPFDGVGMEKAPSMRYASKIDAFAILATAKEELQESDPEAFKALILALVCGLRRSEIDNLLWRAFDFPNSALSVETSEFHELKSEDSAGVIDLDADTLALFRGYRAKKPKSIFVIESPKLPRSKTTARRYRCDAVFKQLLIWLRANGVDMAKPIHTMRKEIGSIIASEHGIFEASRYLRHSDIRITSAIYADKKKVVTPKTFAGVLAAPKEEVTNIEDGRESDEQQVSREVK